MKLLVVEDEPAIADFLVRGLREEGFIVEHAANGPDASRRLALGGWDAVVLDWYLPGADGLSVLTQYRREGGAAPVLFLTARDAVSDRVRGLDAGADDYLCKPFAFEEFLARVRSMTRRRDGRRDAVLAHSGVTIDLAAQRATRDGGRLDLTAKEYALLLFFMRRPGEVLTRTRIYEVVWEERYDGLSNTLEVHVMELRKKLGPPPLIATVRGRGYVFGEP